MVDERSVLQTAERPETVRENQQWTLSGYFHVPWSVILARRGMGREGGREGGRDGGREGGRQGRGREGASQDVSLPPFANARLVACSPQRRPQLLRNSAVFWHCLGQNTRRLAEKMALRTILHNIGHAADTSAGPAPTGSQPHPTLQDGRERSKRAGHRDEDEATLQQRTRRLLQVRANVRELGGLMDIDIL
jgi:hypothetical protein